MPWLWNRLPKNSGMVAEERCLLMTLVRPPQDDPRPAGCRSGIANANPGGGQAVFPSELTGITDKYHSGKVGGAVGKGGEPGPHAPSSQNKVIDIGGMATG